MEKAIKILEREIAQREHNNKVVPNHLNIKESLEEIESMKKVLTQIKKPTKSSMRILELEQYAQSNGFDSVRFKFRNKNGEEKTGKWLDAYSGLFTLDGQENFMRVSIWRQLLGDAIEFEIIED